MDARIKVWKQWITMTPWCGNCLDWNEEKELCKKFNARPPAKVIHEGCEQWVTEIPF